MNDIRTGRAAPLARLAGALALAAAIAVSLSGIAKDVHFSAPLLGQAFTAGAGFDVAVPPEVVEARALMARHPSSAAPLALGPGLQDDPLLQQRLWEALYPSRLHEAQSGRMLWKVPGPDRPGCTEIGRSERLVLVDCP